MFKRTIIFQWLTAALALAPVAGYAYLGQFSRMMSDDYCQVALGKEMGAWDYMIYKFNTWAGSYANWFFKGTIAPLDTLLPRMMPALIVVLWLVGMSWLVFQRLAHLKIEKPRWALSVMIAALAVAGGIHAFYSPQSFYWYAASTHYTLPLALLTIYLALVLWLAQRPRPSWWSVIAGGALCFITAGASEMFAVFQAAFLTFCLLACFAFLRPAVRRPYALVFGIGWLATLMGLVIQLSSPGVYLRAASIVEAYGQPNRGLSAILSETLSRSLGYIEDPQVFAGLIMLMGVGLLVMLIHCEPQAALGTSKPVRLALPPLWFGLMVQLIFVPILWLHTSDHPQLLGRFSVRYMTAIMLNIVFLLGFLALFWRRNRINVGLQKRGHGALIVWHALALMFAVVLLAFIRTQDMHYRASAYLTASFLVFLGMIIWQLLSAPQTPSARKIGLLALFVYAAAAVCIAAVVGAALFGRGGFVAARTLAPGAYLLTLPGLIWGIYIGYLIKNHLPSSRAGQAGIMLLKLMSLAIVLTVAMGIVLGQAALAPDFQLYAKEWDARHQEIIAMRDGGQTAIDVGPLTYDLADFIHVATLADYPSDDCAPRYYHVASIAVADD